MKWTCKVHTYERRGRQMYNFPAHFLILMPVTLLSEFVFRCGFFLTSSSNISKTPFLDDLCTMTSIR